MLAIYDCFFITTASISFSLPQISSYWKVSLSLLYLFICRWFCFLDNISLYLGVANGTTRRFSGHERKLENRKNGDIKDNGTSGCGFSQLQQMKIGAIEGDFIKEQDPW